MTAIDVLVVDDSPADRALIRIAFEQSGLTTHLHFATSGREALDLLMAPPPPPALRPDICVLDVKMPGLSGLDVLRTLKADAALAAMPVIMFSGSDEASDVAAAYAAQASGYIKKPADAAALSAVASTLGQLCTSVLAAPPR